MADKFQLYLPFLHILILLNTTTIQKKRTSPVSFSSFSSIQSHRRSCSLFLPTSTCHLYQSLSALRLTGRLLNALYPWLCLGRCLHHITLASLYFPTPTLHLSASTSSSSQHPIVLTLKAKE